MIDNWFQKSELKRVLNKLVKRLLIGRISANSLTITGLGIGLLSALFIFLSGVTDLVLEFIMISTILMSLSFFIDILDGAVARLEGPTVFGGILDIFCDRIVEVFIILAIISTDPISLLWPGLFSLSAIILCITIFLIVGGVVKVENLKEEQKIIYYSHGFMERTETFIFLIIITIFFPWRVFLLWIFAILIFITAFQRLIHAYKMFYSIKK
ncbi:MAG: CDP-alcohol phosphatidyltransferase family protein [Promethearchaeota archaeon]